MSTLKRKEMGDGRSNDGEENAEKRGAKRWSKVWDHFTLNDERRAICKWCGHDLCGDSKAGTSHLDRHITKTCKKSPYKNASIDFQSCDRRITAEYNSAFVQEKILKSPSDESGMIFGGDLLTGENNKLAVQLPAQLALQKQNGSNMELGMVLTLVSENQKLIEQQQQQDALIKELREAVDRAKTENRKERDARVASEKNVSAIIEKNNALINERALMKEALDCAMAEAREEKEARVAAEQKLIALTLERDSFISERDLSLDLLYHAMADIKTQEKRVLFLLERIKLGPTVALRRRIKSWWRNFVGRKEDPNIDLTHHSDP